ncbi:helix-turn-helix transcriptional regulator [Leucobacter tenebrionis]|uniref:helix-turn-helix transcriptional regulator n=1 Tax=Leucobacter tenebrionis TaxID=2873270 RepID=UPI001CA63D99|nr:WYL domain-containing protein [Leucobacter tenebrionis]QZY51986.1 WYL domain-containing protein [Leucobacter tenebrionis]
MRKNVLAPERVLLLLSLIPYLREHGPTPVPQLAEAFDVAPDLLRRLVRFLGTAGVPGETLSYQHEDLFDIDWDALERDDVVSLTRTVAVDDAPRFAPSETAALIAGLQALTPMLPEADARVAQRTAAKLGAALGAGAPTLSVTADDRDPRIPIIVSAIDAGRALAFDYRDAAGRASSRTVDPLVLTQQAGAWYLRAHCRDRDAPRSFRVDQMSDVRALELAADPHDLPAEEARVSFDLVASLPAHLLPRIRGFEPETIGESPEGRVRVRIEAWHEGAAIRLVQTAPGEIVIESPEHAREAVRAWAEQALGVGSAVHTPRTGIN